MKREKAGVVRAQERVRSKGTRGGGGGGFAGPIANEKLSTIIAGAIVLAVVAAICILVTTMVQRGWNYALDTERLYVEQIVVSGAKALTEDEIISLAGIRRNEPILSVDLTAAAERIMKHARVEKAVVERHLPRTIQVNLTERVPIGLVQEGNILKGIDASGKVLPLIPSREDIKGPIITGEVKDPSTDIVREALQAIELLRPDVVTRISEVRVDSNGGITLLTTKNAVVIRLGRGDMARKVGRLRAALKMFDERNETKEYIDVRFEDMVTRP